jgi:hypothetical protein
VSNQPINPAAQFNRAIKVKDADEAWRWAQRCKPLSLDRALSLTLVLGLRDDHRYRPAATRFMERYEAEGGPTKEQVGKVREDLDRLARSCPMALKYEAIENLGALVDRLAGRPPTFE